MKINLREELNRLDFDTFCKYDLVNIYESLDMSEDEKRELVKMIANGEDADTIGAFMNKKHGERECGACDECDESVDTKKEILYVIKDKHGNQLSRPNPNDIELWDKVEDMDPYGRKGLAVVVYVEESLKENNEDVKVIGGIFEFVEGNQSLHNRIVANKEKVLPIEKINEILVSEDAKTKAYNKDQGGYDKCYVDLVIEKGGKRYRFHGARFDLGDNDPDKTFTQDDLDYVVNLYKEGDDSLFSPMDESMAKDLKRASKKLNEDSKGIVIGKYIDPHKENYEDVQYSQYPNHDERVEVIGGQTVDVSVYPTSEGLGHSAYFQLKCTDGGYKTHMPYIYQLGDYIERGEIVLDKGWEFSNKYPYLKKVDTVEESKNNRSKFGKKLKEEKKDVHYYLVDSTIYPGFDYDFEEFIDEKEFFDSLAYNHGVAVEYEDDVRDLEEIKKEFVENDNHEEELNGFRYIKLTNTSIDDYLGESFNEKKPNEHKDRNLKVGDNVEKVEEGVSKDMTPKDIAKKHSVSLRKINDQLKKGIEVEKEHTNDEKKARRITGINESVNEEEIINQRKIENDPQNVQYMKNSVILWAENDFANNSFEDKESFDEDCETEFAFYNSNLHFKTLWELYAKTIKELQRELNIEEEYIEIIDDEDICEDTIKTKSGKWVNKGDTGETHGTFKTKKAADAQRRAMFSNGYKESLHEQISIDDDLVENLFYELKNGISAYGNDFDFEYNDREYTCTIEPTNIFGGQDWIYVQVVDNEKNEIVAAETYPAPPYAREGDEELWEVAMNIAERLYEQMDSVVEGLKEGVEDNTTKETTKTPRGITVPEYLWTAVCNGKYDKVKQYFEKGKETNKRYNRFGRDSSLIMGALRNGDKKMVELLKSFGETIIDYEKEEYDKLMDRFGFHDSPIDEKLEKKEFIVVNQYYEDGPRYDEFVFSDKERDEQIEEFKRDPKTTEIHVERWSVVEDDGDYDTDSEYTKLSDEVVWKRDKDILEANDEHKGVKLTKDNKDIVKSGSKLYTKGQPDQLWVVTSVRPTTNRYGQVGIAVGVDPPWGHIYGYPISKLYGMYVINEE